MKTFLSIIIYFILFEVNGLYSQVIIDDSVKLNYNYYSVNLNKKDSNIILPAKFIQKNSIIFYIDSSFVDPENYEVDHRFGIIKLDDQLVSKIFNDPNRKIPRIEIFYKNYPFSFKDSYSKFEILKQLDTTGRDTVSIAEIRSDLMEDIFAGSDLQKSGNIFRGFTVGNNRDFTINSGFRLQLEGKLSQDIDITAALTDETSPIQPEGNTQKLQELDKVFIELRSKNITATLGDIEVNFNKQHFFNFNRKVQGAKGYGQFNFSDIFVNAALSRGSFNSNSFNGIDGNQGPYRLIGKNNEVNIIVLAGTERVYLNGEIMTRGETNDYVIDYSIGQITFTTKRLISAASRIVVDFEYSDKKYSRNLISGQVNIPVLKDKFNVTVSYMRENDDKDKPIDFILSEEDRAAMINAGDDIFKASKSGVVFVGVDSTSGLPLGLYYKVDTLITNQPFTFYRYQPGDSSLYQVSFSFVGSGKGDYISLSTTAFRFAGVGQGNYLPVVLLPLPALYQSADVDVSLRLNKNFNFRLETAVSDFDKNLYSANDDTENKGLALISSATYKNNELRFSSDPGFLEMTFSQKYVNKLYNSIDRLNRVEYNRVWDIRDSSNQTELTTEGDILFSPVNYLFFRGVGGIIKRGDSFNSQRGTVLLNFRGDSLNAPSLLYSADIIASKEDQLDYKGLWLRQSGLLEYDILKDRNNIGLLRLFLNFNGEDKKVRSITTDNITNGSYRYYEFIPGISLLNLFNFDVNYKLAYRFDDVINNSAMIRQSNSLTHNVTLNLKNMRFISSNIDLTVFDKKYSDVYSALNFDDAKTILLDSRINLFMLNNGINSSMFYKVSNERTARSEIIFIRVPIGQGNYIYKGDLNQNGIQDETEFQLVNYDGEYIKIITPTDQTFPTTSVQASTSFSVTPGRFVKTNSKVFNEILNNLNLETYLAVDEKNKDPKLSNIYLLKLSHFQNDENTINGSTIVRQDLNLFENHEYFGIRLRFNQKRGFNQFFSGNERQLYIERAARLRLSFTPDLSFVNEFINEQDRNAAPNSLFRNRNIVMNSLISELTYIPFRNVQVGFNVKLARANDRYPTLSTQADINSQIFKFSYGLENIGKIRVEAERTEAILSTQPEFLPYELTKGKLPGKSYFWTVALDYRLTNFIQATLNYFGRVEGDSKVIHTGTAEFKAFF